MKQTEVENIYQEFWKPIVEKNGKVDIEQIKKELADYWFILQQVPKVYMYITGDRMSKPNYYADVVIAQADDHIGKLIKEAIEDEVERNEPK